MNENPKSTLEHAHFLNEQQKKVKQKIMEECLQGLFGNLEKNKELFDLQSIMDLVFSVLIMFNRDVLVHVFTTTNAMHIRKDIVNHPRLKPKACKEAKA
jgi:hypothetical protein